MRNVSRKQCHLYENDTKITATTITTRRLYYNGFLAVIGLPEGRVYLEGKTTLKQTSIFSSADTAMVALNVNLRALLVLDLA